MNNTQHQKESTYYHAIVIGVSYGGFNALQCILPVLPENFPVPVIIVQHIGPESDSYMISCLNEVCKINVKEAEEKEKLKPGVIYFAPANYHLLIEDNLTFSLAADGKINFARPSIDVLFESAAFALGPRVIGVILTGANSDGSMGLKIIKDNGGLAVVQDPQTAAAEIMPQAALEVIDADTILPIEKIGPFLVKHIFYKGGAKKCE